MSLRTRGAAAIGTALDRVVARAVSSAAVAADRRTASDLAIADLLTRHPAARRNDPAAFVSFLRDCFDARPYSLVEVKTDDADFDRPAARFETLVQSLIEGAPAVPDDDAVRLALAADGVLGRRDPFERPQWAGDVGRHAKGASSFGYKGRLLMAVVRFARSQSVLEIGTAYGLSALFIAAELPEDGRLVTLERSHPQVDVAREVLSYDDRVRVIDAISHEVGAQINGSFDFFFHDAEHSEEAYIRDFGTFEPKLVPGAVAVFDDIDWEDPLTPGNAKTYSGWRQVVSHPRVRRAFEIDGNLGMLLLR